MVDVISVCWGDRYSDDYVRILKSSIEKNTTKDFRFLCYSDKVIENIECLPLIPGYHGWWNKLQIFNNESNDIEFASRKIYFDLDIVITGNIDWLFDYNGKLMGNENNGIVNKYEQHRKNQYMNSFMSAVMAWDSEYAQFVWNVFLEHQKDILNHVRGDGEFLDMLIKQNNLKVDFIQQLYPGKFRSYKYECYEAGKLIEGTTLVDFHGEPDPHQAFTTTVYPWGVAYEPQEWVGDYWKI
jgi:hypothetical protein